MLPQTASIKELTRPSPSSGENDLPIHFFTIVLNGEPFIRYHIDLFNQLPFRWHWHIIEGVAELRHDTAWSLQNGGRIREALHCNGLSNDGTTSYVNGMAGQYPDQISVYRKKDGAFWDGKLEMVNAPLDKITEECLLWEIDSDELWTVKQLCMVREMFQRRPDKDAAQYLCHFFVGERLVTTTLDTYGNHTDYEWHRTWRFRPGYRWSTHEPPVLCKVEQDGSLTDIAVNLFTYKETLSENLLFQHYAYATEGQLQFKQSYYGYGNAVRQWQTLQKVTQFPVPLKDYFDWVKDDTQVNTVESEGISPLAQKDDNNQWQFAYNSRENRKSGNLLWIRTDSIGDNVISLSMLPHIHKKYAAMKITVLCQKHIAELYETSPFVENIITFNRWEALNSSVYLNSIIKRIRSIRPEIVLNSVYSRDRLSDAFSMASGAVERVAISGDSCNISDDELGNNNHFYTELLPGSKKNDHELVRHGSFLKGLGISVSRLEPLYWISEADERFAEDFFLGNGLNKEETILLFPGAQFDLKVYTRYESVINKFRDITWLILGNDRDSEISSKLCENFGGAIFDLTGKTTLGQAAAIIRRCGLYLGADTSGAHMACAVGTPNVVILGGGQFGRFLPYSPLTSVVCLPMDCYGCNWKCKYKKAYCVDQVSVESIVTAVSETRKDSAQKARIFFEALSSCSQISGVPEPLATAVNIDLVQFIQLHSPEPATEKICRTVHLNEEGERCASQGDMEGALNFFSDALRIAQDEAVIHNNLGVAYHTLGQLDNALDHYQKAVGLNPTSLTFRKNLADFHFVALNRLDEAARIYIEILKSTPNEVETMLALALLSAASGNAEDSRTFLRLALKVEPNNSSAIQILGSLGKSLETVSPRKSSDQAEPIINDGVPCLTYSRLSHFRAFNGHDRILYGKSISQKDCDLKAYQDLLVYTYITENISKGSRILEIGGGDSRILKVISADYECWNLDKLEGVGNGPKVIDAKGYRLIKAYIGEFSKELPDNYFDFIFSISALEHVPDKDEHLLDSIKDDINRVLRPGGHSLHCFDIVIKKDSVWSNRLLPFLFQRITTVNAFIPFSELEQDPDLYVMTKEAYDLGWKGTTQKEYDDFGKPASYNILWEKPPEPVNKVRRTSAIRNAPKISIVTPSFNQGDFLEECIDSILAQGYPNLEYIIMDGGSKDSSVKIIRKYEKHLSFWRSHKDDGQYAAINEGLQRATGDIMAWLNSDDKYHEDTLFKAAYLFNEHPDIEWLTGRPTSWNEKGELVQVFDDLPLWSREKYLLRAYRQCCIQQESTFWSRSLWQRAGARIRTDMQFAGDLELWVRFFRHAKLHTVDALLGGYRYQPNQKTHLNLDKYFEEADEVINCEIDEISKGNFTTMAPPPQPVPFDRKGYNKFRKSIQEKKHKLTIATSIAPKEIELQKKAIESWINLGFDVISMNSKKEIDGLESSFPDITFIEAKRSGTKLFGRPLIFLDDVIRHLLKSGSDICGIINSDIYLTGSDDTLPFILREAADALVYGSRIDVASLDILSGDEYLMGYDYFFFPKTLLADLPATDFCIGAPWWDYWLPLFFLLNDKTIKKNCAPFAYHRLHPVRFSNDHLALLAKKMLLYLRAHFRKNSAYATSSLFKKVLSGFIGDAYLASSQKSFENSALTGDTVEKLAHCIVCFLNDRSSKIDIDLMGRKSQVEVAGIIREGEELFQKEDSEGSMAEFHYGKVLKLYPENRLAGHQMETLQKEKASDAAPPYEPECLRDAAGASNTGRSESGRKAEYYDYPRPEVQALVSINARKILDIGCGAGALGKGLKERQDCHVTGIEFLPEIGNRAKPVLDEVHIGDAAAIVKNLPAGSFDTIIMADFLEHIANQEEMLANLKDLLSPGGKIIMSIPNVRHWSVVRNLLEGKWDYEDAGILDRTHLRFFTLKSIHALISDLGYRIDACSGTTLRGYDVPEGFSECCRQFGIDASTMDQEGRIYQYLLVCSPAHSVSGEAKSHLSSPGIKMSAAVSETPKGSATGEPAPLTSIIILAHNELDYTKLCIESINRHTDTPFELIFIDNASTDGTADYLENEVRPLFPSLTLIRNNENLGFAAGNNQGIAAAKGDYILLLNNDVVVTSRWLERLTMCMEENPKAGIVGPMSNYVSGLQLVKEVSYDLKTMEGLQGFADAFALRNAGRRDQYFRIVGFCMLIRRAVVDKIGGLDDRYGLGNFEDDDFCLRSALAGFESFIAGDCFIHHFGSRTFAGAKIDFKEIMLKNWEVFKRKWGMSPDLPPGEFQLKKIKAAGFIPEKHYYALHDAKKEAIRWPRITVVTPSFNQGEFLEKCITSVLDQNYPDLEFIIMDGGSSDHSVEIIKKYEKRLAYWQSEPDGGQYHAINEGFKRSTGEIMTWLNSDDKFHPDAFRTVAAVFAARKDIEWLTGRPNVFKSDDRPDGQTFDLPVWSRERYLKKDFKFVQQEGTFWRRSLWEKAGATLDTAMQLAGDLELWARFFRVAQFYSIDAMTAGYRIHPGQKAQVFKKEYDEEAVTILEREAELFKEPVHKKLLPAAPPVTKVEISRILAQAMDSPDEDARRFNQQGEELYSKGDLEEALKAFIKAIEYDPRYGMAHNNLGVLYYNLGDQENVLACYKRATELQPSNPTFQKNLADFLYFKKGNADDAIRIYTGVLSRHPDDIEALLCLAHISHAAGLPQDALDFYSRIIEIDRENEEAKRQIVAIMTQTCEDVAPEEEEGEYLVSAIVSTYNSERFLRGCLDDLLNQTIADRLEIIVVDSGSRQDEEAIVKEYQRKYSNINYIRTDKRETVYAAWNRGVKAARGKYITNANSDDRHSGDALEIMANVLKSQPDIALVYADVVVTEKENETFEECTAVDDYRWPRWSRKALLERGCFMGPQPMWRKKVHDEYGYFDESFVTSGDFEFWLRISQSNDFLHIPLYLGLYLKSPTSIEHSNSAKKSEEDRKIFEMYNKAGKAGEVVNRLESEKASSSRKKRPAARSGKSSIITADRFYQKGNLQEAVDTLLKAIGGSPEERPLYHALAGMLLDAREYRHALDVLKEMPETASDLKTLELSGYCEEGLGNFDEAANYAEQTLALNSRSAPALNLKGLLAFRQGDPATAEILFKEAIAADAGYGEACNNLGMIMLERHQARKALDLFEKAFILSPGSQDIAETYHSVISEVKDFRRAEVIFGKAKALHPYNRRIAFFFIDALIEQGKFEAAIKEIGQALVTFGIDDGILDAGLAIREKTGSPSITKRKEGASTLSVCMIVKNEEEHLARCLNSLTPVADEIIVVDTGSDDRTKKIAGLFGTKIYDFEWNDDFSEARNFSISKAEGDWVLAMDADEALSPQDNDSLADLIRSSSDKTAYSFITRNYTLETNSVGWQANDGQYINEEAGSGWVPSAKVRLFPKKKGIGFQYPVHEVVEPSLKKAGIKILPSTIPVHHYGKMNEEKVGAKGEDYYLIGRKKLKEMGDNLNALKELAIQAGELEKYDEAIDLWQRFIALDPNLPDAFVNIGSVYMKLGQYDKGFEAAKKALEISPGMNEAGLNYATCCLYLGDAGQAIIELKRLLERSPDYLAGQFKLAVACCCMGEKKRGIAALDSLREATRIGYEGLAVSCHAFAQNLIIARQESYAMALLEAAVEGGYVNRDVLSLLSCGLNDKEFGAQSETKNYNM